MGWANCGEYSKGRQIGYAHRTQCDEPGCSKRIDRGVAFACGGMHGTESLKGVKCCEGYFCGAHLFYTGLTDTLTATLCDRCADARQLEYGTAD